MKSLLVFVLYDSVTNSVFTGQILQPLLQKITVDPTLHIMLVTFEKNVIIAKQCIKKHIIPNQLHIHFIRRTPFLGRISLYIDTYKLKKILPPHAGYTVIARGPLAGLLCLHAHNKKSISLTVQARGLLSEEYKYVHGVNNWWHRFRTHECKKIEYAVYHNKKIIIEVVSHALKQYLINSFDAKSAHINLAKKDIPELLSTEKKQRARTAMRQQLAIKKSTKIYCYNGSAKPWQCPERIVSFFVKKYRKNSNIFLLILTQDINTFLNLLQKQSFPPTAYHVCTVKHAQIYNYLAACDIGIIFREPHIINWVARPTKVLEYRAAKLAIVHNNTIAYLTTHSPDQP